MTIVTPGAWTRTWLYVNLNLNLNLEYPTPSLSPSMLSQIPLAPQLLSSPARNYKKKDMVFHFRNDWLVSSIISRLVVVYSWPCHTKHCEYLLCIHPPFLPPLPYDCLALIVFYQNKAPDIKTIASPITATTFPPPPPIPPINAVVAAPPV